MRTGRRRSLTTPKRGPRRLLRWSADVCTATRLRRIGEEPRLAPPITHTGAMRRSRLLGRGSTVPAHTWLPRQLLPSPAQGRGRGRARSLAQPARRPRRWRAVSRRNRRTTGDPLAAPPPRQSFQWLTLPLTREGRNWGPSARGGLRGARALHWLRGRASRPAGGDPQRRGLRAGPAPGLRRRGRTQTGGNSAGSLVRTVSEAAPWRRRTRATAQSRLPGGRSRAAAAHPFETGRGRPSRFVSPASLPRKEDPKGGI
eukprot:scaffold272_cov381-Prasinococcus_capsulatus_cf.AAC.4